MLNVSPATWNALSQLLDEALSLEPAARAAWLAQLATTQPQLAPLCRDSWLLKRAAKRRIFWCVARG